MLRKSPQPRTMLCMQLTRNEALDLLSEWGAWNARRTEIVLAGLDAGLSVSDVARLMNLDRKTISRIRNNSRNSLEGEKKSPPGGALQQNLPGGVAKATFRSYDGQHFHVG